MPDPTRIERAEAAWGDAWETVWSVLGETVRHIRLKPLYYCIVILVLFCGGNIIGIIPASNWDNDTIRLLLNLTVLVSNFIALVCLVFSSVSVMDSVRGGSENIPRDIIPRLGKVLSYGFLYWLVIKNVLPFIPLLGSGMVNNLVGVKNNIIVFNTFNYLHLALAALLISRLGLVVPSTLMAEGISLHQSWQRTYPYRWPLFLTVMLWFLLKQLPTDIIVHCHSNPELIAWYFNWVRYPYVAIISVVFFTASGVWYERVRAHENRGTVQAASSV